MTGAAKDLGNPVEAKLLSGHQAGADVPPIVTNCTPLMIKIDLYPSSEWIITRLPAIRNAPSVKTLREKRTRYQLIYDLIEMSINYSIARSIKKKSL